MLEWKAVDGAIQYQMELDNNADLSAPELRETTSKTSLRTKSLTKGTTYYWRVRVKDKAGNWSNWSTNYQFFVP